MSCSRFELSERRARGPRARPSRPASARSPRAACRWPGPWRGSRSRCAGGRRARSRPPSRSAMTLAAPWPGRCTDTDGGNHSPSPRSLTCWRSHHTTSSVVVSPGRDDLARERARDQRVRRSPSSAGRWAASRARGSRRSRGPGPPRARRARSRGRARAASCSHSPAASPSEKAWVCETLTAMLRGLRSSTSLRSSAHWPWPQSSRPSTSGIAVDLVEPAARAAAQGQPLDALLRPAVVEDQDRAPARGHHRRRDEREEDRVLVVLAADDEPHRDAVLAHERRAARAPGASSATPAGCGPARAAGGSGGGIGTAGFGGGARHRLRSRQYADRQHQRQALFMPLSPLVAPVFARILDRS